MKQHDTAADIKLFVSCHQMSSVPKHPLLNPIQVGAALTDAHFPGFLHDDAGENISRQNRSYCELTAQYWAWKNSEADYYGFFHYRRYLYPDIKAKRPYRIEGVPTLPLLNTLGYEDFGDLIQQYDLILPSGENMYIPVREHYGNALFHHRRDLELAEKIVKERHPEMIEAMEKYMSGTICYFGNIFIMRRQIFFDYCSWLFPLLEEFDYRTNVSGYSPQERRVDGYLAERLLGVWVTWLRQRGRATILELPRVHFFSKAGERRKKRILNALLPPSTWRRAATKRWKENAKRYLIHERGH